MVPPLPTLMSVATAGTTPQMREKLHPCTSGIGPASTGAYSHRGNSGYPFMIFRMPSAISLMPSSGVTAFVVTFPKTGWMTFADICP